MINQVQQASNQYGFYAVPRALEPKKKYRETYEQESKYSDEQAQQQAQFEQIERDGENQKELQRDFYVDEAPYPQFKPKQRGLDYGVQIERHQLFDFDLEVQPLIQILVGRSVVSAINQLQQQKQKNEREVNLDTYQKKRNAQLMQTQRLQAKHNRKQDEAKRRVLQKQTYVKNKKIATQKLIARRNAKHQLLNLRNQIVGQLQQQGYLRQSTYLSLRVQYQSWLYDQIKNIVNQHKKIEQTAQNLIKQKQKQIKDEHQKNIEKQNKRRKDILDQRERVRKQNQQRKLKKKIRKQRLHLNQQRAGKFEQANELVQKYEPAQKILKAQAITNGLTKKKNTPGTVHIAGGLLNYILAIINNSPTKYTSQQLQTIIQKVLNELSTKLQIEISSTHLANIEELKAKMQADPIQFMNYKQNWIQELVQKISLEVSVLEASGISINSQLHSNILHALMSIYLNCLPAPKMEGEDVVASYEPNQRDKKRQELKTKLQIVGIQGNNFENIKKSQNVIRVRFQKIRPQPQQKQQQKQKIQQKPQQQQAIKKQVNLDQWIDVYDGQGWQRQKKQQLKQAPRQGQQATSYALTGFDNTFVMDQRNLYFLEAQLQKLLGISGGQQMNVYRERLENLIQPDDKVPIYDVQLKWQ